jgi:hypothetical protein
MMTPEEKVHFDELSKLLKESTETSQKLLEHLLDKRADVERLDDLQDRVTLLLKMQASGADQRLQLADRVNRNTTAQDKLVDALLQLKQRLTEIYDQREFIRAGQEEILRKLAIISKDVDDVEKAAREATGAHKLHEESTAIKIFDRFTAAPRRTQITLVILLAAIAAGGWLSAIFNQLFGEH